MEAGGYKVKVGAEPGVWWETASWFMDWSPLAVFSHVLERAKLHDETPFARTLIPPTAALSSSHCPSGSEAVLKPGSYHPLSDYWNSGPQILRKKSLRPWRKPQGEPVSQEEVPHSSDLSGHVTGQTGTKERAREGQDHPSIRTT